MSDKPGFSAPDSSEIPEESIQTQPAQQQVQPPTPPPSIPQNLPKPAPSKPTQETDWSLKEEAKEWGKTLKESVLGTPELDPQAEMQRQVDEQKKIANIKQFFNQMDSQQQILLQEQKARQQQKEQAQVVEDEQKKQASDDKKKKTQDVEKIDVFNAKRRTEIKKVGG